MVTRQDCLDGLREAAKTLGHPPSRPEYRRLRDEKDVGPSVTSLQNYLGGTWNAAKEEAGLSVHGVGGAERLEQLYGWLYPEGVETQPKLDRKHNHVR